MPEADVEDILGALVARASGAWPDVRVDPARFAEFLGGRVSIEELPQARAEDLWIAFASAAADPAALAIIEARYFPDVVAALGKMGLTQDRIGEVKQGLRGLLFVGDGTTPHASVTTEGRAISAPGCASPRCARP
jgi:hypothetical protein